MCVYIYILKNSDGVGIPSLSSVLGSDLYVQFDSISGQTRDSPPQWEWVLGEIFAKPRTEILFSVTYYFFF